MYAYSIQKTKQKRIPVGIGTITYHGFMSARQGRNQVSDKKRVYTIPSKAYRLYVYFYNTAVL